ncbi:MAG: putative lyase [Gemmataceae bacterium]|nr:putative lyase [Gemmataceae bacterium]
MRYLRSLLVLVPLAAGCGKKPAPPPPPETGPGPQAESAPEPEEPSERDKLLATLKTRRGDTQREAADALAALAGSDPKVLDALVELMKDRTTAGPGKTHPTQIGSVREAAAVALLRAGPKGEAALKDRGFAALREGLTDKDPAVREHTAHTIGLIGPPAKPLAAWLQRLCTDPDPNVHGAAFDALRAVGVADVTGLAALLTNKDPGVRRLAAEVVSTLTEVPPDAVFTLTRALDDEDEVIRVAAATGIAAAGPKGGNKVVAEKLAEAIRKSYPKQFDPETARPDGPETQYWVALTRIGGKVAEPAVTGLLAHKNMLVRVLAARTLGDFGPDAKPAVEALRKALTDPEYVNVPLEAAVTLCRLGEEDTKDAVRLVELALGSTNRGVAAAGIEAVARMGPAGKPLVPEVLKQLASPMADARYAAVVFVGMLDPAEAAKQVPELAKLAADEEPLVRRRVGVVLAKLGPAAAPAADAIGKALPKEMDESVREQFVDTLVAIGPGAKPAVAGLVPLIADATAAATLRVKVIGAVAVADPGSKDAAAALVKAAGDSDPHVRAAAAGALGKLTPLPDDARAALVKLMRSDPRTEIRSAAVRGLTAAGVRARAAKPDLEAVATGTLPGPALWAKVALAAADGDVTKAAGIVRDGLADRSLAVRTAAAEALVLVGPTAADVPALVRLSREPAAGAKEAAATALGRIGPGAKDAVAQLAKLLNDRDGDVRIAAAEALGRIGPAAVPAAQKLKDAIKADPLLAPTARKALDRLGVKEDVPAKR